MKKYLYVIILVFGSATNSFSQSDSAVPFIAYWSLGDSYDFKITKIKQRWSKGKQTKHTKVEYKANFLVIDSSETSYTIKWSFENLLLKSKIIPKEWVDSLKNNIITKVIYKTTETGAFTEILNWKEIGENSKKLFTKLIDLSSTLSKLDKKELQTAMDPFKKMYATKQGVEQLLLEEILYFHMPMGLEFNQYDTLKFADQLPNLFGGKPLKADAQIIFTNVDFENGICSFNHNMDLDPVDTKRFILEIFSKMGLKDKEISKQISKASLSIKDRNKFEYYFNPGVPSKIETTRETLFKLKNEVAKSIKKTKIELIFEEDNND